jgi:hypothetical protein
MTNRRSLLRSVLCLPAVAAASTGELYPAKNVVTANTADAILEDARAVYRAEHERARPLQDALLEMAHDIVKARSINHVVYVDVGNMPKHRAEQYMRDVKARWDGGTVPTMFLPVRNNGEGRGTRLEIARVPYDVSDVLKVYRELKDTMDRHGVTSFGTARVWSRKDRG